MSQLPEKPRIVQSAKIAKQLNRVRRCFEINAITHTELVNTIIAVLHRGSGSLKPSDWDECFNVFSDEVLLAVRQIIKSNPGAVRYHVSGPIMVGLELAHYKQRLLIADLEILDNLNHRLGV